MSSFFDKFPASIHSVVKKVKALFRKLWRKIKEFLGLLQIPEKVKIQFGRECWPFFQKFANAAEESFHVAVEVLSPSFLRDFLSLIGSNVHPKIIYSTITEYSQLKDVIDDTRLTMEDFRQCTRLHGNFFIRDEKDVLLGSSTLTKSSFGEITPKRIESNILFLNTPKIAEKAERIFDLIWNERETSEGIRKDLPFLSSLRTLPSKIEDEIKNAEGQVFMIIPSVFDDNIALKPIIEYLRELNPTIQLKILTNNKIRSNYWSLVQKLREREDIKLVFSDQPIHAKIYIFDDWQRVCLSSMNLNHDSWIDSLEVGTILSEKEKVRQIREQIEEELGDLHELESKTKKPIKQEVEFTKSQPPEYLPIKQVHLQPKLQGERRKLRENMEIQEPEEVKRRLETESSSEGIGRGIERVNRKSRREAKSLLEESWSSLCEKVRNSRNLYGTGRLIKEVHRVDKYKAKTLAGKIKTDQFIKRINDLKCTDAWLIGYWLGNIQTANEGIGEKILSSLSKPSLREIIRKNELWRVNRLLKSILSIDQKTAQDIFGKVKIRHFASKILKERHIHHSSVFLNYFKEIGDSAALIREVTWKNLAQKIKGMENPNRIALHIKRICEASNGKDKLAKKLIESCNLRGKIRTSSNLSHIGRALSKIRRIDKDICETLISDVGLELIWNKIRKSNFPGKTSCIKALSNLSSQLDEWLYKRIKENPAILIKEAKNIGSYSLNQISKGFHRLYSSGKKITDFYEDFISALNLSSLAKKIEEEKNLRLIRLVLERVEKGGKGKTLLKLINLEELARKLEATIEKEKREELYEVIAMIQEGLGDILEGVASNYRRGLSSYKECINRIKRTGKGRAKVFDLIKRACDFKALSLISKNVQEWRVYHNISKKMERSKKILQTLPEKEKIAFNQSKRLPRKN